MKPDWKDAPKFARFIAADSDGCWCWFRNRPEWLDMNDGSGMWVDPTGGEGAVACMASAADTLEARPEGA